MSEAEVWRHRVGNSPHCPLESILSLEVVHCTAWDFHLKFKRATLGPGEYLLLLTVAHGQHLIHGRCTARQNGIERGRNASTKGTVW